MLYIYQNNAFTAAKASLSVCPPRRWRRQNRTDVLGERAGPMDAINLLEKAGLVDALWSPRGGERRADQGPASTVTSSGTITKIPRRLPRHQGQHARGIPRPCRDPQRGGCTSSQASSTYRSRRGVLVRHHGTAWREFSTGEAGGESTAQTASGSEPSSEERLLNRAGSFAGREAEPRASRPV